MAGVSASALVLSGLVVAQPASGASIGLTDAAISNSIDEMVKNTPTDAMLNGLSRRAVAEKVIRCTDLNGLRYCLGVGFTDLVPNSSNFNNLLDSVSAPKDDSGDTGGDSLVAFVEAHRVMSYAERQQAVAEELSNAAEAVGKQKDMLTIAAGGDTGDYPEDGLSPIEDDDGSGDDVPDIERLDPPHQAPQEKNAISTKHLRKQIKNYYCGPATMQTIDLGDGGTNRDQGHWAKTGNLNTDRDKQSSTDRIVLMINKHTKWKSRNGTYAVRSIHGWSDSKFGNYLKSAIGGSATRTGGPVVLNVNLKKKYFAYLAYNAGGHFQVGQGYKMSKKRVWMLEVYNEKDFRAGGNNTSKRYAVSFKTMRQSIQSNHGQIGA